ncbi:MAG: NUDIX hydrolase [Pseudomonadota bacterium]|nr:NUDIX hydrolase [Pseudomonadota bacterium]
MAMDRPLIGLGAIVFRGDDVLMIRRAKPPRQGQWAIPGGRQERGETIHEGAVREVLEETAVTCRIGGLVDVVDSIGRDDDGAILWHYTLVDLWAEWVAGEAQGGSDALEAAWFAPGDFDGIELWPETRRVIDLARQLRAAARP